MPNIMDATDAAYLAGLIDGEGSVAINFRNPNESSREVGTQLTIQLTISMTDHDTLLWVADVTGTQSKVYSDPPKKVYYYKPTWTWRPTIASAYEILSQCLPYMKTKKRNAEIFLELIEIRRASTRSERNWERQFELATENRSINKRGV